MAQRLRETVGEIAATKQYLENLLEHANDFIYTLDLEGRVTYLNHQFLELGLRKEDFLGEPFEGLARRLEPAATERVLFPLPRQMFEVQMMGRDGRSRTLVVTESPMVDDDLRRIGTLGIAKDVTELTELQARLIRSERLASVGELAGRSPTRSATRWARSSPRPRCSRPSRPRPRAMTVTRSSRSSATNPDDSSGPSRTSWPSRGHDPRFDGYTSSTG